MASPETKIQRRVAGSHDWRLDGISDLILRADGASVLDVGCNRGMVGYEFAKNGARLVHGCDHAEDVINVARHVFVDMRAVRSQFEVVDLAQGPSAMAPFTHELHYDIILLLAVVHKLARIMSKDDLSTLMRYFGKKTTKWIGWRATADKQSENDAEFERLKEDFAASGLRLVQYSTISEIGPSAIWGRKR